MRIYIIICSLQKKGETMKPKAQEPYDCEAELKKLPTKFWLGVPTAQHIPHRYEFSDPDSAYTRKRYSDESWEIIRQTGHKLFPHLCKPEEFDFYIERDNRGNKTFAVYKLPDGSLCKESCYSFDGKSSETMIYTGTTIKSKYIRLERGGFDPKEYEIREKYEKQIKKLENLWNKLRKKALRDAKKEPGPKVAKKKAQDTKSRRQEEKIKEILKVAIETRKQLNAYIRKLRQGKIIEGDIGDIYDQMIRLSMVGKEYKQITGVSKK
ncbi:hypothetical protein ACFL29_00045 [Patescibacteria group bacterium]